MRLPDLFPLARDTVSDPRDGYRRVRALGLRRGDLWQALAAVTALSVILAEVSLRVVAGQGAEPAFAILADPLTTALIQFALLATMAYAIFWGGRMLGGVGSFPDALLAIVWLQFILACLQILQAVTLLVAPFIAGLIGVAGLVLFFWLLSGFVAQLHGFYSRGRVLAGIVIGLLGMSFALTLVLILIGASLGLGGGDVANV
jgi:hypothetical protein